jgi:hydroxymethylbilane synthase
MSDVGAPIDDLLPAPSQGAIGIELLADNKRVAKLVTAIDDRPTSRGVGAERAFLAALGGDCRSAVAAQGQCHGEQIRLRAEILMSDGSEVQSGETEFSAGTFEPAVALAHRLLAKASPALRAMFAG